MRVSTALISQTSLNSMLDQQKKLSDTQLQVSTGKRLLSPSDDPYGSARTLDLEETIGLNDQYQVNAGHAKNRLALEEGTLDGFNTALQRVRELMIVGNNDSQTVESRSFMAEEVQQLLDQVLSLANAVDSNGEYIFGGYQGKTKPFEADGIGNFIYYGDAGQRFLKVGAETQVAVGDSGHDAFVAVRNGNGTFQTQDDSNNKGTGIIDPGTVSGQYVADNYKIKFLPPSSGNSIDPVEYYVLDGNDNIIEPAGSAGTSEAAFLAAAT
ncbi:MAG: flagellar hook-associated protein FlgL, partial [Gammaproteobacteria bacterium]|nr:flagellar hook-associated protein FlgL [Gammaproteobacteria bacterium]